MSKDTYRGWSIGFEYGWCATHPDYDASWEGEEYGWVGNGLHITGCQTRDDLIEEIDAAQDEWQEINGQFGVGA